MTNTAAVADTSRVWYCPRCGHPAMAQHRWGGWWQLVCTDGHRLTVWEEQD